MATPRVLRFDAEGRPLEFSVWLLRVRHLLEIQVQAHETLLCLRSTGDPRLILGKGYRHVGQGGYGRTDPLLNKPFYPNGLVVGILTCYQSDGLGLKSQCVHIGHPSAGGCQRSTGDPRLILGKGYRHVGLGVYGRTDPLLNKPFYPNGLVVGILTCWRTLPVRTASEFLIAIKARHATPTTVSLGRLFLPFLFPELASFECTADLITHLRSLDSSYRAACADAQLALLPPPMAITIYFIAISLPDRLASVCDALLLKHPSELTIEVLESALKDVESNLRSVDSASDVVPPPLFHGCAVPQLPTFTTSLATAATGFPLFRRASLADVPVASVGTCVDTSPGAAPEDASLSLTLDSGASHCFFRDCTTLTPLPMPVSVALADPTSGPVTARYTTTLPCPTVPSGSLTGIHVPSFSRNLVGVRPLVSQHVGVWIEPSGKTAVCVDEDTYAPLATFTVELGSGLYTLHTGPRGQHQQQQQLLPPTPVTVPRQVLASHQVAASPQVAVSGQVPVSGLVAASCSCRSLAHSTVLWHHQMGHPSISRLRAMSRQRACNPSLGSIGDHQWTSDRLRATPHSSSLRPATEPFETLHLDICGPASRPGPERESFFLVVVDDYSRYTTVFPLAKKSDVTSTLFQWLLTTADTRGRRVSCLHSGHGGEFHSGILAGFCREQGMRQSWTLPESPRQNGVAERRIGLVMEIARTSMTHAHAPHFLWPYAVSPTSLWTGSPHAASRFRVRGCLTLVRDTSVDKISPRAVSCVFLGFLEDSSDYTFYHPPLHRFFDSCDVRFDKSVPYYVRYPCRGLPIPPAPLFLTSAPPPAPLVQPPPPSPAPSSVSHATPPPSVAPQVQPPSPQSSSQPTADPAGAGFRGEDPGVGAEAVTAGDSSLRGAGVSGAVPGGATTGVLGLPPLRTLLLPPTPTRPGTRPVFAVPVRSRCSWSERRESWNGSSWSYSSWRSSSSSSSQSKSSRSSSRSSSSSSSQLLLLSLVFGPSVSPLLLVPPPPLLLSLVLRFLLLTSPQLFSLLLCPCCPLLFLTLGLRVALLVLIPRPLFPSLTFVLPRFVLVRLVCLLLYFFLLLSQLSLLPSLLLSQTTTALTEFASTRCFDYATSLVAAPPTSPLAIGGEFSLGCDALEDRQFELEFLAAASPHLCAMQLAPEGDPYALDILTPRNYAEAVLGPWASQWRAAMDSEMASYISTGTYIDEVPPLGANVVDGMWIFRVKQPPGSPSVFKARYVARGFSLVTLYLCQWRLRRPVYGLRQAPREWHDTLRSTLFDLGFQPSSADPSLFVRRGSTPFFVLLYVDDLVFATTDRVTLADVKLELQKRHTCTDLGELRHYLGLQITRDRAARTIILSQSHMVQQVLRTPLLVDHRLTGPFPDKPFEPSGPFAELVGCLMYLMTCTRPDLAFPINILARFVAPGRHRPVHWIAAMRVAKYLAMTSGVGLVLRGRQDAVLTGHCDSSYADDAETHRSTQGYYFSVGSGAVSWWSTCSSSVSTSTTEAEIYAGAMASQELR
ncbi:unnamed protein product [Closterium sp. NIES-54]